LGIPVEKIRYHDDDVKTSTYGVCHIYIGDVILRRVVDEISAYIMKEKGRKISAQ